jgi:hypothetical protein
MIRTLVVATVATTVAFIVAVALAVAGVTTLAPVVASAVAVVLTFTVATVYVYRVSRPTVPAVQVTRFPGGAVAVTTDDQGSAIRVETLWVKSDSASQSYYIDQVPGRSTPEPKVLDMYEADRVAQRLNLGGFSA